ncbi:putative DNA primase/helicase [Desulfatibacillum alkenivorans DSM 16219]|jgi:putative DNA primase/helicase|uniref:Putative DNA primase/helicase n=1 Tax=Desulfatibacillum alkenivorans DSM 16219 TaxID=1121393 RepID=A0A1M6Q719_9BACT|nr:phage/plasmid primase, P4 family [Desulfatibacillum alkenivorans]SHK15926.1 putative DNA primase/helicase [Desulfatibacillum alkenivorans DSM 16219]
MSKINYESNVVGIETKLKNAGVDIDKVQQYEDANDRINQEEQQKYLNQQNVRQTSSVDSKDILKALYSEEDGDASLYIKIHKDHFCFDHAAGKWFEWKGHHWELDKLNQATADIDAVIDAYGSEVPRQSAKGLEATKANDSEARKKHEKIEKDLKDRIAQLQHRSRRINVLKLAMAGRESLAISGEEWDLNPWLLGCPNGTIDLKTGDFRPGEQSDYIQAICPTEWKGLDAQCPNWEKFLKEVFNNDADLVSYMQRLFGYGLTGLSTEHVLPILYGQGRNGKGTLLETLSHVLGELAQPVQAEMLLEQGRARSSSAPSADLMKLRGCRMVWASETDEGRRLNAGKVKWLTGGDSIPARPPYGTRIITFKPTHTLFLITNHKPRVPGDEYALWKRIHLIPFSLSFVPDPQLPDERPADKRLPQKLQDEAPGILAWLVKGCLEWKRIGDLKPPRSIKAATEAYQEQEDILGHFISDCCSISETTKVSARNLYQAYQDWCNRTGHYALSETKFGMRMGQKFNKKKSGTMIYEGIELAGNL